MLKIITISVLLVSTAAHADHLTSLIRCASRSAKIAANDDTLKMRLAKTLYQITEGASIESVLEQCRYFPQSTLPSTETELDSELINIIINDLVDPKPEKCQTVQVGTGAAIGLGAGLSISGTRCKYSDYRTRTFIGAGIAGYIGIGGMLYGKLISDDMFSYYEGNKQFFVSAEEQHNTTFPIGTSDSQSFVRGEENPFLNFKQRQSFAVGVAELTGGSASGAIRVFQRITKANRHQFLKDIEGLKKEK